MYYVALEIIDFQTLQYSLENTEGFENLLFLKPHSTHEHHVIITFWQDEAAYKHWQESQEYKASHKNRLILNDRFLFTIDLSAPCLVPLFLWDALYS